MSELPKEIIKILKSVDSSMKSVPLGPKKEPTEKEHLKKLKKSYEDYNKVSDYIDTINKEEDYIAAFEYLQLNAALYTVIEKW